MHSWECVVCFDSFPHYALIPCGHQALCWDCLQALDPKKCPICMKAMTGYLRIFPCSPYPWKSLVEQGFPERSCRRAYARCNGNLAEATQLLRSKVPLKLEKITSGDPAPEQEEQEGFVKQCFDLVSDEEGNNKEAPNANAASQAEKIMREKRAAQRAQAAKTKQEAKGGKDENPCAKKNGVQAVADLMRLERENKVMAAAKECQKLYTINKQGESVFVCNLPSIPGAPNPTPPARGVAPSDVRNASAASASRIPPPVRSAPLGVPVGAPVDANGGDASDGVEEVEEEAPIDADAEFQKQMSWYNVPLDHSSSSASWQKAEAGSAHPLAENAPARFNLPPSPLTPLALPPRIAPLRDNPHCSTRIPPMQMSSGSSLLSHIGETLHVTAIKPLDAQTEALCALDAKKCAADFIPPRRRSRSPKGAAASTGKKDGLGHQFPWCGPTPSTGESCAESASNPLAPRLEPMPPPRPEVVSIID